MNAWEIREGRWQDSPVEACDHIVTDPPYDERTHSASARSGSGWDGHQAAQAVHKEEFSFGAIGDAEIASNCKTWLGTAQRWVIAFCAVEQIGAYSRATGDLWVRGGIYLKTNPKPQFSGDRPGVWGDGIAIMHRKGRKRWNNGGHCAKWTGKDQFGKTSTKHHETQKPLDLMLQLIEQFTDPGDLVWDPYAGSGSTGVACVRLKRRFVGHELQPHYAEIARQRLTAEGEGLTLDDVQKGQLGLLGEGV